MLLFFQYIFLLPPCVSLVFISHSFPIPIPIHNAFCFQCVVVVFKKKYTSAISKQSKRDNDDVLSFHIFFSFFFLFFFFLSLFHYFNVCYFFSALYHHTPQHTHHRWIKMQKVEWYLNSVLAKINRRIEKEKRCK